MKKRAKQRVAKQVYTAELPLRLRAARLQAAANRNEGQRALKADIMRSELARIQGILNLTPTDQQMKAAQEQLKQHLRDLAQ